MLELLAASRAVAILGARQVGNILALPTVKDALPGRVDYINLWPLSAAELTAAESKNFIDKLLRGTPPELNDAPLGRRAYADRIVRGG